MRNIFLKVILIFLVGCQNNPTDYKKTKSSDSSLKGDANKPNEIERILDSIRRANPQAQISIEGGEGTEIDQLETRSIQASDLKIINTRIIDSLINISHKKYTLLHFWATWCVPCRKEFPEFIKDIAKVKNTNVILISSDYDTEEQRKKVLAVYKKLNTRIPLYITKVENSESGVQVGTQIKIINYYGIKSDGALPFNLLIENSSRKVLKSSGKYEDCLDLKE